MAKRRKPISGIPGVEVVQRELTRTWIAYLAVGGFVLVILVVLIGGWVIRGLPTTEVLQVVTTVAGVFGGLAGAAIGFYFRSEQQTS